MSLVSRVGRQAFTALTIEVILFLSTFHAYWAFKINPQTDEGCYLKKLSTLILNEGAGLCVSRDNYFAWGAPLTWWPAGFVAKWLSLYVPGPFIEILVPVVSVYSHFLLAGVFFFLFLSSKLIFKDRYLSRAFLIFLNIPILYYAGQRPLMSHTVELLWVTFTLYFCLRENFFWACCGAALTTLTRYNDFPIFLLVFASFYPQLRALAISARYRLPFFFGILISLGALGIVFLKGLFVGYGGYTFFELIRELSWENTEEMLFGLEWGVFWMSPIWPVTFILAASLFKKLSLTGKAAVLWMGSEFFLYSFGGGSGGDFGHRYLIGSFLGCFLLFPELENLWPTFDVWSRRLQVYGAAMTTYLFLVYKSSLQTASIEFRTTFHLEDPFIVLAIKRMFDGQMWDAILKQNLPMVEVWISKSHPERMGQWFYLDGFDLIWLQAVVMMALTVVILYALLEILPPWVKKRWPDLRSRFLIEERS